MFLWFLRYSMGRRHPKITIKYPEHSQGCLEQLSSLPQIKLTGILITKNQTHGRYHEKWFFVRFSINNLGPRHPEITIKYFRTFQESPLQLPSLFQSDSTSTRSNKNSMNGKYWWNVKGIPPAGPCTPRPQVRTHNMYKYGYSLWFFYQWWHFTKLALSSSLVFFTNDGTSQN